jgi:hypothetical protein
VWGVGAIQLKMKTSRAARSSADGADAMSTSTSTEKRMATVKAAETVHQQWPNARGYKIVDVPTGLGICLHTFFIKEHTDKSVGADAKGRTLFVGNIDYCKDRTLDEVQEIMHDLFGSFGEIESVSVSEFKNTLSHHTTRFAHVTFDKRADMKSALAAAYEAYVEGPGMTVVEKWGSGDASTGKSILGKRGHTEVFNSVMDGFGFRYSDTSQVKEDVYSALKEFEENELIAKAERERRSMEADEEGFVTVKTRYVPCIIGLIVFIDFFEGTRREASPSMENVSVNNGPAGLKNKAS